VASGLFADGAVALVARGDQAAELADASAADGSCDDGPHVVTTYGEVYPDSTDVLGWRLGDDGFRIVLTAELSEVVGAHIGAGVTGFLARQGLAVADIASWICHPGGPRVIDAVQDGLGLPPAALALTRRSLAEVGNMSSASVLHVLQQVIETDRPPPGSAGLMIGLGPGVSVELLLLRW
jgi:alkylresorcinol/alkylpyrone synthase